jgi:hypothetical protein
MSKEETMLVIDLLNMIALKQKLPKEIEYNGDIGKLVKENGFINYIFEKDGNKYDLYWLIDHDLNNLNDNVKVLRRTK